MVTIGIGCDLDDDGVLSAVDVPVVVRDPLKNQRELLRHVPGAYLTSGSAASLVASVAYWTILVLGLLLGLTALDAALPTQFAVSVLQYVPHLMAALVILVIGNLAARFLGRTVLIGAVNLGVQYARLLSVGVKWMVLIVATAMALDHIGIGRAVLLLAFAIAFGGVVLAVALAVGLGTRDLVASALNRQFRGSADDNKLDHV